VGASTLWFLPFCVLWRSDSKKEPFADPLVSIAGSDYFNPDFQSLGFGYVEVQLGPKTYDVHRALPDADGTDQVDPRYHMIGPDPAGDIYLPVLLVGKDGEQNEQKLGHPQIPLACEQS
jgi:hypothetical protein